jgi:hypothetical protein
VAKSKREKKISKVMGEFKAGDLKSGGSGKKVTNPKQAIAIALSEANAMNQGGMMYNEIMNRPMFQTPQMRQGGGIMAGVAPIRGYAEGDFVGDLAEEVRGFGDFLRNPEDSISPELYEALKKMTTEEAFTAAGSGALTTAAITALMQLHPVLRRVKGFKPKPKPRPRRGMSTKEQAEGLADPKSKMPMTAREQAEGLSQPRTAPKTVASKTDAPETPAPGRVARAKDAVSSATSRVTRPVRAVGRGIKSTAKGAGIAGLGAGATDLAFGTDYLSSGLSAALDAALRAGRITKEEYDRFMATPEISALSELFSGPTPPEAPEAPSPVVVTESGGDDTETAKPKTFLDMLKGAGGRVLEGLQDPATRYALAKAAQPSEGFVPRDFFSDFTLGKEEYKQLEAQREPDDTALIRNYQFLKETTDLADNEIISLLSNQATPRDEFMTLFSEAVDTAGSVTPEQIAQFEAATGYRLPEDARVSLGVAAAPSDDID